MGDRPSRGRSFDFNSLTLVHLRNIHQLTSMGFVIAKTDIIIFPYYQLYRFTGTFNPLEWTILYHTCTFLLTHFRQSSYLCVQ